MARTILPLALVGLVFGSPASGQSPPPPPVPSSGAPGRSGELGEATHPLPPETGPGGAEAAAAFGAAGPCGTGYRFGVSGEGLLWWLQGMHLPPLVTTSPAGTPPERAGVLQEPGTRVLFGDERADEEGHFGGRITFSLWLDEACPLGVEGNFFL